MGNRGTIYFMIAAVIVDAFIVRFFSTSFFFVSYVAQKKKEGFITCKSLLGLILMEVTLVSVLGYAGAWITKRSWDNVDLSCVSEVSGGKKDFIDKNRGCFNFIVRHSILTYSEKDRLIIYYKFPITRVYFYLDSGVTNEYFD